MDGNARSESGTTQRPGKGFPQLMGPRVGYTLPRTALAAAAVAAFVTAIVGATTAIEGHSNAGVEIDSSGRVAAVSPTGFAWRDGIRPGQLVLTSTKSDSEEGWLLITEGPSGPVESRESPLLEALRASVPFAIVGLGAGCLAILFLRTNREWSLPASCLAVAGTSIPLFLANHPLAVPTLLLAAGMPVTWATWRFRQRRWFASAIAIAGGLLLVGWAQAYTSGSPASELEQARRVLAFGGTGLLMAERAVENRPTRPLRLFSGRVLLLGTAFIVMVLALVYVAAFPAPVIAVVIVIWLLAAPGVRGAIGRRIELALMADLREHVAADVAEEERGRLARELHDAPLQELSAVIRRLELVPGADEESRSLRNIADQLRSVAIDLRPPMLDDLGLGAALDFLAEQLTSAETRVVLEVADKTSLEPSSRPPAGVEFAIYRISREALANALRHAQARNIWISGSISRESIDLVVRDDGVGVDKGASRRASGRGHLGLASMRRRAQAIAAELAVEGTSEGTRVSVAWRA